MSAQVFDLQGRELTSNEVFVIKTGMFNMWVCAPKHLTREQVQAQVDIVAFPSGTTLGWRVEEERNDDPELTSPGNCAEDCNRQHWNCVC